MSTHPLLKKTYETFSHHIKQHQLKTLSLDIFKDKSVALVGNAESLLHDSYGKEIDSHDIIIRMNLGYPYTSLKDQLDYPYVPQKWIQSVFIDKKTSPPTKCYIVKPNIPDTIKQYCAGFYTGFKTDIWSFASNDVARQKMYYPLFKEAMCLWPHPKVRHLEHVFASSSFKTNKNYFDILSKLLNHRPSTGLILINLLSDSDAQTINLYGFDFFATPHIHRANPLIQQPHHPQSEKQYVLKLLKKDPRFRLKPYCPDNIFIKRFDYVL